MISCDLQSLTLVSDLQHELAVAGEAAARQALNASEAHDKQALYGLC